MYMFNEWRGFDLTQRCEKFYRALRREPVTDPEQIPISIFMPMYPGGQVHAGLAYYEDPAVMLKYQEDGHFWHLSNVEDDTIPYFMPWFGTGVLASAFGCAVRMPTEDTIEFEPARVTHCLESPKDVARLKMPDPYRDGLMPTVLKFIDYAVAHSDLPVGLTDMKGFAGGRLFDAKRSPFGVALTPVQCIHYALTRPAVASILAGYDTPEHVDEAVSYETATETEKDYASVLASAPRHAYDGQCTYCGHCKPCPAGIDIAMVNKLYDLASMQPEVPASVRAHYEALERTASDCIGCRGCETRCPFHVPVAERMEKARALFAEGE